jgi:hypothetical protein
MREKRRSEGIDLDKNTWGQLAETAISCGVSQTLIDAARLNDPSELLNV